MDKIAACQNDLICACSATPSWQPLQVDSLFECATAFLRSEPERSVDVRFSTRGQPVLQNAHPDLLLRVIIEAVNNVEQAAARAGTPEPKLDIGATCTNGGWVTLSFVDNAGGFPKEYCEQATDGSMRQRAFQSGVSTRAGGGAGLAEMHFIARAHSGFAKIQSPYKSGSLLCVELPGYSNCG
jgi:K+-sensing histidine kinase KdpD